MLKNVPDNVNSISEMDNFLKSPEGQKALRNYHEGLNTLPKLQKIDEMSLRHKVRDWAEKWVRGTEEVLIPVGGFAWA